MNNDIKVVWLRYRFYFFKTLFLGHRHHVNLNRKRNETKTIKNARKKCDSPKSIEDFDFDLIESNARFDIYFYEFDSLDTWISLV